MARFHFQGRVRDSYGNTVKNQPINITITDETAPAKIFTAYNAGTYVDTLPQITSNTQGFFEFWVDNTVTNDEVYFDIEVGNFTYERIDIFRPASRQSYTPTTSGDWQTIPTDIKNALDIIAGGQINIFSDKLVDTDDDTYIEVIGSTMDVYVNGIKHINISDNIVTFYVNLDMLGQRIVNLGEPVNSSDGVTKYYVDNLEIDCGQFT